MMSKMDNMVTGSQLTAATQQLAAAVQQTSQSATPTFTSFQPEQGTIGAMGGSDGIWMDIPTYFQLQQQAGVSDAEALAQLNSQMQNFD